LNYLSARLLSEAGDNPSTKRKSADAPEPPPEVAQRHAPEAGHRPGLLRCAEVCSRVGVRRVTIWRMVKRGEFPKPVPLRDSSRAIRWREGDVTAWIAARRSAA